MEKNMVKKFIFLLLIGLFFLPFNVKADTFSMKLNCPDTVSAGATLSCTLSGTADFEAATGVATFSVSSGLTLSSFTGSNGLSTSLNTSTKVLVMNDYLGSGEISWGTLNLSVASSATGNLTVSITSASTANDSTDKTVYASGVTETIRVKSTDNTLSKLTVSGTTFTFSSSTTTYNLTVAAATTTITATKANSYATVTGDVGTKNLDYGLNTFKVVVTSESGTAKTYTLNITRPDNRSKDNNLNDFSFDGYEIDFDKDKTSYSLDVDNKKSIINVCSEDLKEDVLCFEIGDYADKSSIKIMVNDKELDSNGSSLVVGENELKIVITAENGDEKTYLFTINREGEVPTLDDNTDNDNGTTNNTSSTDKGSTEIENPKTGSFALYMVLIILVLSIIFIFLFFKKKKYQEDIKK